MAIKTQIWKPDTHPGMEITIRWDDADPLAQHVCAGVKVNGVSVDDPDGYYAAALALNRLKNFATGEILTVRPNIDVIWAVADDGVVELTATGLTAPQRAAVITRLSNRFGTAVRLV